VKDRILTGNRLEARLKELGYVGSKLEFSDFEFPARATQSFLNALDPSNAQDPLLLQILPQEAEREINEGYSSDPVADQKYEIVPGLIHKYHNRVLLIASNSCAIHCRYCFRKAFPYHSNGISERMMETWSKYIRSKPELKEVIFSGGDPLYSDRKALLRLCEQLSKIKHIKALRFHTRVPIVCPEMIEESFIDSLALLPLRIVFVLHANHVREINDESIALIKRLHKREFILLSQSVLLKGINDSVEVLAQLFEKLTDNLIMPYYLNLLDKVTGSAHFEVEHEQAMAIYRELLATCSGYTVPKLVRDDGGANKRIFT
jgi:EF-P beta-lysylation protein EpmB